MTQWTPITSTRQDVCWIRGKTMNGQLVHGRFIRCCPGVCYLIKSEGELFRIVHDFEYTLICPPYPKQKFLVEYEFNYFPHQTIILSMKTLSFWFNSGVSTKSYLTVQEIYEGALIHPMSEYGLTKHIMPAPILNNTLASLAHFKHDLLEQSQATQYFMETGELVPMNIRKTICELLPEKLEEQEISWHISRMIKYRKNNETTIYIQSPDKLFTTLYIIEEYSNTLHIEYNTPFKNKIYYASLPISYNVRPLYDDLPASPTISCNSSVDLSTIDEDGDDEYPSQIDTF